MGFSFFLFSCEPVGTNNYEKPVFNAKGFAYIYSIADFNNKIIKTGSAKVISKEIGPMIFAVKSDHQNNLWIGTKNNGLLFYPKRDFIHQKPTNYLKGLTVTDIFQDKQDNIWIATLEKGVFVIKSLNVLTYKLEDENINLEDSVKSLVNILTNNPGFLVILVPDAAFSIEKLFAIYTLSLKLIFYLAWMYEKGCASKPKKKSLQVNPKYNFNGHERVLKN